ncbi:GIY-YIG nuclease family protein [Calycomorphotria hydatis]|nr:GIY-YIG nuclease family protein [Calycomorphotria hydatis]
MLALMSGGMTLVGFLGLGGIAIAGPAVLILLTRVNTAKKAIQSERELRDRATKLSAELDQAIMKYRGFEKNFGQLVKDEERRLAEEHDKRMVRANAVFAEAEESNAQAQERQYVVDALGKRFLADSVKWISAKLTPNNFTAQRDRLVKVIEFCRKKDYAVTQSDEKSLINDLRNEFERVVRRDAEKQEQARIKAQIREEQRAERELKREMDRVEAEKKAIQKALDDALKIAADEHSAEIELLREKLREAEEKAQRTLSMAQQTRAGYVYVISNLGSFGEDVYKIGMTRRLEPMDRVKELGDASVPFPFDVHMMISCDDAPALENALHRTLHPHRVNKINLRKEYFRTDFETIRKLVEENHGIVEYEADMEALEYRQSEEMTQEDFDFVSNEFEKFAPISLESILGED